MLGGKGTGIELLCGLLTLAGEGVVGPSFGDDVIFTLGKAFSRFLRRFLRQIQPLGAST